MGPAHKLKGPEWEYEHQRRERRPSRKVQRPSDNKLLLNPLETSPEIAAINLNIALIPAGPPRVLTIAVQACSICSQVSFSGHHSRRSHHSRNHLRYWMTSGSRHISRKDYYECSTSPHPAVLANTCYSCRCTESFNLSNETENQHSHMEPIEHLPSTM